MTQLLVATRSRGKEAELRALLASLPFQVVFPDDIGLQRSVEEDDVEAYATFEANARAKAHWFAERSGLATLADDSGLEVDALDGAPGVRSRRFGGCDGPDHDVAATNNAALLAALIDVPDARRMARYRCVLVLAALDGWEIVAEGVTEGRIVRQASGTNGFGYDPLFFSSDLGMTFGQASPAAKHSVSHRARAVAALVDRVRLVSPGRLTPA